ncbi:uncharacterized protein CFAP97D2-like [Patella vulgata]|uniref:uncharacterized protein CFAP97D2-like n=1 Tax=Patella vulgata TaxID=6465 RepID=UPI00217FE90B|nr:uncharacterized protein CFAP97D2-like [Patella vulgata]
MHRAYQPITPANNLYLKQNWDRDVYRYHRKRVQAAKAVIDNHPPKTYMHLHIKLKKLQIEDERLAIIEKDNRILIEKMAHIMRTGGRVDNVKHDYCRKSLNKTKRYRELLRITYENLAILKRINSREPHYNHIKWAGEWQINRKYMMNITKYPNHWHTTLQPIIQEGQREANRKIKSRLLFNI